MHDRGSGSSSVGIVNIIAATVVLSIDYFKYSAASGFLKKQRSKTIWTIGRSGISSTDLKAGFRERKASCT